jgi:hypothetical protein
MANRYYRSQFMYNFEKMPVKLFAQTTLAQLGQFATLVNQGLTYTAVAAGTAGNSITVTLVDPAANSQALAITVTGTDIVVSLATDGGGDITTTATILQAALAADAQVAALVSVSGSGGSALVVLAETALSGGVEFTGDAPGVHQINQTGTGLYQIVLQDKYKSLLAANIALQKATGADLYTQLISEDVDGTKIIAFRTLTGATATTILSGDKFYVELTLRNSAS